MSNSSQIEVLKSSGKGRACILLYDSQKYEQLAAQLFEQLQNNMKVLLCRSPYISDSSWKSLSDSFLHFFSEQAIRHCSLVSFGAAGTLVQYLALSEPKIVRSLVLVDGSSRPHPSLFQRIVDRVEQHLPLGLPLRSSNGAFDSKPFLQQIHCPLLLVRSPMASAYQIEQLEAFLDTSPTAWSAPQNAGNSAAALAETVLQFQDLPVKFPQKRRVAPARPIAANNANE